jgi:serine/threonine protein kinase
VSARESSPVEPPGADPAGADAASARRWADVESHFAQAVQLPPAERAAFLAASDMPPALRRGVEALLSAHDARYRVRERLGGGGMGVVYRARDERLQRDVAFQFLPSHLSAEPEAKRRVLVEARAAASLEHPNICTVHEIGESDGGPLYIVMACSDGETLDRRIARGPLPVAEAVRIAGEIARGLARARTRQRAPRHQAGERHAHARRAREGARRRHREARRRHDHAHDRRDRHPGVHASGAGVR